MSRLKKLIDVHSHAIFDFRAEPTSEKWLSTPHDLPAWSMDGWIISSPRLSFAVPSLAQSRMRSCGTRVPLSRERWRDGASELSSNPCHSEAVNRP